MKIAMIAIGPSEKNRIVGQRSAKAAHPYAPTSSFPWALARFHMCSSVPSPAGNARLQAQFRLGHDGAHKNATRTTKSPAGEPGFLQEPL